MKPVIAIVGRPNVGKSTLFNRLTRSRTALVAEIPGLTRDRQYGDGRIGERPYLVVDTGGLLEGLESGRSARVATARVADQIMTQTRQALAEADAVILMVDTRAGAHAADKLLASDLRRLGKPIVVAVNKAEGLDPDVAASEFHTLGLGQPLAISAAHGEGVGVLIDRVFALLPEADFPVENESHGDVPHIAVVGRPNAGKSTLVNAMLGEGRVIVSDQPGTTRDSIQIPLVRNERHYVLFDTAGVRRRARIDDPIERFSVIKTLQAIDAANVVILMLDAAAGVADQDAALAGYALAQGRAMVLAANKWDLLTPDQREYFQREVERKLPFLGFARLLPISALRGKGVDNLFPLVDAAFASATRSLPTPQLTRLLQLAIEKNPPPLVRGRRIKPKYAHQGGRNPPRIVIHGNQVTALSASYKRYLSGMFREGFHLVGTPVVVECRQERNPYAETGQKLQRTRKKPDKKSRSRIKRM